MSQSQACLEMRGLQSQKGLIVDAGQIVMMLLGVDIGPEIERSQVLLVIVEDLAILREGLVPLFEVDIGLGLEQMQMNIVRVFRNLGIQHLKRIAPFTPALRRRSE